MILEDLKEVFVGESIHGRWRGTGDYFYGNEIDIDGRRINEGSGFRPEFQDNTDQINHVFGGLWGAFHYSIVPEIITNLRENGDEDLQINYVTFPIGNLINDYNISDLPLLLASGLADGENYDAYSGEAFVELLTSSISQALSEGQLSPEEAVNLYQHAVGSGNPLLIRAYNNALAESNECFLAGTPISLCEKSVRLADINSNSANKEFAKPIEKIKVGEYVISYNDYDEPVCGKVVRTFQKKVSHILDVHGLKVTPGHVTLCGDGPFANRHVPIIDILLSDSALVKEDGSLVRMAIDKPVGSIEDQFVEVAYALTAEDARNGILHSGRMRVGTLLFDRDGAPVSVLDCLRAEGLTFDPETGLVAREGQAPEPLRWFGPMPRPEDYILRRSQETLEGILVDGEWEGAPSELIARRLRHTASQVH